MGRTCGSSRIYARRLRAVVDEVGGLADMFACSGPGKLVRKLSEILDTSNARGWEDPVAKYGEEVLDSLLRKPRSGVPMLPVLVPCAWAEPGE